MRQVEQRTAHSFYSNVGSFLVSIGIILSYSLKSGPFPASFFIYFRLFNTVDNKQMFNKILPMTGVEPWTSGIESDRSTN